MWQILSFEAGKIEPLKKHFPLLSVYIAINYILQHCARILFVHFCSAFNIIEYLLSQTDQGLHVNSNLSDSFLHRQAAASETGETHTPHYQLWCSPGLCSLSTSLLPAWMSALQKTSSWNVQMTSQSSASSNGVTSLKDWRLNSWLSGAVVTTLNENGKNNGDDSGLQEKPLSTHTITIMSSTLAAVESFRFLDTSISQVWSGTLTWTHIVKKAQQRLTFYIR